jgi:hypothetical protein
MKRHLQWRTRGSLHHPHPSARRARRDIRKVTPCVRAGTDCLVLVVYNSRVTRPSATLPRRIALDFTLGFVPPAST